LLVLGELVQHVGDDCWVSKTILDHELRMLHLRYSFRALCKSVLLTRLDIFTQILLE